MCPFWKLPNTDIRLSLLYFLMGQCYKAVLPSKNSRSLLLFEMMSLPPYKSIKKIIFVLFIVFS